MHRGRTGHFVPVSTTGETARDLPDRTFEFARRIVNAVPAVGPGAWRQANARQSTAAVRHFGGGANCEEAQAGQSRADFLSKISIACKEDRETR